MNEHPAWLVFFGTLTTIVRAPDEHDAYWAFINAYRPAKRTYKPRPDRPFTHSWAWGAVQDPATRHRFVSLTVEPGDKLVIRAYD